MVARGTWVYVLVLALGTVSLEDKYEVDPKGYLLFCLCMGISTSVLTQYYMVPQQLLVHNSVTENPEKYLIQLCNLSACM